MTRRPRITARYDQDAYSEGRLCNPNRYDYVTPGVELRLEFDLHDHQAALALLDRAVEDVRGQIAETTTEDA